VFVNRLRSLMAWPDWPWPARFYDRSRPLLLIKGH